VTGMRAINCPCGTTSRAWTTTSCSVSRPHINRDHPEMQRSDPQLRERIASDAYDV